MTSLILDSVLEGAMIRHLRIKRSGQERGGVCDSTAAIYGLRIVDQRSNEERSRIRRHGIAFDNLNTRRFEWSGVAELHSGTQYSRFMVVNARNQGQRSCSSQQPSRH
eukprot:scaffold1638_cov258-Pinguiococcus_pyrenoidosus.AAC.94